MANSLPPDGYELESEELFEKSNSEAESEMSEVFPVLQTSHSSDGSDLDTPTEEEVEKLPSPAMIKLLHGGKRRLDSVSGEAGTTPKAPKKAHPKLPARPFSKDAHASKKDGRPSAKRSIASSEFGWSSKGTPSRTPKTRTDSEDRRPSVVCVFRSWKVT